MKFLVSVLLIALLSFAGCLYMPWWSIAFMAFLVTVLIHQNNLLSFLSGFVAIMLLWTIMALAISSGNDDILAHRASRLIISIDSPFLLAFISGLIGAITAGTAALAGSFVRQKQRRK